MKIVLFYHCYLYGGDPPRVIPNAFDVVLDQMSRVRLSGLADVASEIIVGINGGEESLDLAKLIMPPKATIVIHGLHCKCENPTILLIERWLRHNQGDAYVLYFHAKSSSHDPSSDYGQFDWKWKECMMHNLIDNWRLCVNDLAFYQAVGCHWLTDQGSDQSQNYFAGTFWWAHAHYLRTLPSILNRAQIRATGIGSVESRYEAEVWIGNGPRLPIVRDYHPGWVKH